MKGWQWVGFQPQIQRYSFLWHVQNLHQHLYLHFPPLNLFLHSTKGQEHVSPPPTAFYHPSFSSTLREREHWPPAYFPFSQDDKKDGRTDRPTEETKEAVPLAPTSSAKRSLVPSRREPSFVPLSARSSFPSIGAIAPFLRRVRLFLTRTNPSQELRIAHQP